jgi:hypothetical protein
MGPLLLKSRNQHRSLNASSQGTSTRDTTQVGADNANKPPPSGLPVMRFCLRGSHLMTDDKRSPPPKSPVGRHSLVVGYKELRIAEGGSDRFFCRKRKVGKGFSRMDQDTRVGGFLQIIAAGGNYSIRAKMHATLYCSTTAPKGRYPSFL